MRCNLLLLLAIAIGVGSFSFVNAQSNCEGPLRGELAAPPSNNLDLEATLETVKLDIIISEIEDAGYSIDVVEGFDEEWEEEIWIATDADDIEPLVIPSDESDLLELDEVVLPEELAEEWEDPTWEDPEMSLEEIDGEDALEEIAEMNDGEWEEDLWESEEGNLDETEFALLNAVEDEEWTEEEQWWEADDEYDESWDDLQDEWELDALEAAYEYEDMEYLEMMYGMD